MVKDNAKTLRLTQGSAARAVISLAVPAATGTTAAAVYGLVDTVFVGMIGTSALGGVTVVVPLYMLVVLMGSAVGMGGGAFVSRLLGAGDTEAAERTVITCLALILLLSVPMMAVGWAFRESLLRLLGATDTILPYALRYSGVLLLGIPILTTKVAMNALLRAEGAVPVAMRSTMGAAVLNVILDPLLIFGLNMGVAGAATATVISHAAALTYILWYYLSGRSYLRLLWLRLQPSWSMLGEITKIGVPFASTAAINTAAIGSLNAAASGFGDAAVASMGIAGRVLGLGIAVLWGCGLGFQPFAGYHYGSGEWQRLREGIRFMVLATSVFTGATAVLLVGFANRIVVWFGTNPQVWEIGARALQAAGLQFLLMGPPMVYYALFNGLGRAGPAAVVAALNMGVLVIPAAWLLPQFMGLDGVIFARPLTQVITILVTAVLAVRVQRQSLPLQSLPQPVMPTPEEPN